jgi:hypothetical protein
MSAAENRGEACERVLASLPESARLELERRAERSLSARARSSRFARSFAMTSAILRLVEELHAQDVEDMVAVIHEQEREALAPPVVSS